MSEQSQPFLDMAARIDRMGGEEFAGAVVIMPPGDGDPIAFLLTDPVPNIIQFWTGLQGRVEVSATKAQQDAIDATSSPYGGRR